eukprot:TRINITY_DN2048_c0_g1_i1.p1 TRINITY_DN2048_c0_g1~~TRINITY_DN2048_c0_g1_i1.p1  ORF type:complete len:155 (-),score=20.10 TRINITY_DN2048_c0_g1_i1:42-506(-)
MEKIKVDRRQYVHNGQKVYEWDQTLEDVNIYIEPPPGTRAKNIDYILTSTNLTVGIKGNPPYLKHELGGQVKVKDSFWTMEDGILHITLQKMFKGDTWLAVFKGHEQLDPLSQEELKKTMMLERFQEENPGFDFSGANFSGSAPDARTFMGGIS